MKCCKKTIAIYLLALALAGLALAGCGKSKGGGGAVSTQSWYQDNDGDGFGNPDKVQNIEAQPDGYVDNPNDCNDENKVINPSAIEIYDNIDNNCNDETDEEPKAGIIPDTGQTGSYTDTLGEDSDYLIDAPSYTKLDANGQILPDNAISWQMVKDNVTGLIWEIKDTVDGEENSLNIHDGDNTYTWEDASAVFIKKLNDENFGSFSDELTWRLPTVREISLLANSTIYGPNISKKYFLLPMSSQIWSSSDIETKAWYYASYFGQTSLIDKTKKLIVLAVRGKEVASKFEAYNSNIIEDNTTGLMWQKISTKGNDDKGLTFDAALTYCENLESGGYKDWRLPNRNELATLFSFDLKEPSIDQEYFSDTLSVAYWSSTSLIAGSSNGDQAWRADFFNGTMTFGLKKELAWVRAVRGGNNDLNRTWFRDGDSDGYGDSTVIKTIDASSPKPAGYVDNYRDCNDVDPAISPVAKEIPGDGIDQNCTGIDAFVWYKDSDDDGYGDDKVIPVIAETKPETYVHNTAHIAFGLFDCNDSNKSIHPGMEELIDDGLDNDCNGLQSVSWYLDSDGDGYGEGPRVSASETAPAGGTYAKNDLDCNNDDSTIHPGLVELFNDDIDSNCNGDKHDEVLQIVPDTGQTATYTGTLNDDEDGDYLINPPSHTKIASNGELLGSDAGSGVAVRDNNTGLYWEVKTLANMDDVYTFENAADYAESLDRAGFTDWRVPTLEELATIANLGLSNPAIDPVYFSNMVADKYWTATDLGSDTKALAVWFRNGESFEGNKTDYFRVISVRGGQSLAARLISNPDGTVTDTESGLMWSDILTTNDTWGNMMDHWSEENIAGYSDWRLPTANDMDTLLDILEDDSVFDYFGVFENMTFTGSFWTSALAATDPAKAVIFSFITGETDEALLAQTLRGIGVRSVKQTRFIVNGDGTVFDSKTGLMWMQENSNSGRPMTFKGVLSYFTTLVFAGYDDWRLPNRNEMISLLGASIDDNASFSAAFKDSNANYWTSSSCPGVIDPDFDYAWQVNFKTETGSVAITNGEYSNTNVFRAVRGGNPVN